MRRAVSPEELLDIERLRPHPWEAARSCYYRHSDLYPAAENAAAVLLAIAETWIREGKWAQAMPVLEETARLWPRSDAAPVARMRVAQCLAEQGHYERAVSLLELLPGADA